jgi:hypothetical protein
MAKKSTFLAVFLLTMVGKYVKILICLLIDKHKPPAGDDNLDISDFMLDSVRIRRQEGQGKSRTGQQETRITGAGGQESRKSGFVVVSQFEKINPICRSLNKRKCCIKKGLWKQSRFGSAEKQSQFTSY